MRSIHRTLAIAVTGMLLAPQVAMATDVEAQIQQMQERLSEIETSLEATNEELEEANATVASQQATIEAAGLEERQGASALSAFIESTDIAAWMAASYNFNFKGTGATNMASGGGNCGGTNAAPVNTGQGYCNPNTFQLDQAWIAIDKSPTSESRGGFHLELAAGQETIPSGNAVNVEAAYVSYLAPILDGMQLDVGKTWTMLGAEVLATNANFNITRGLVWGLQPVSSTGAVAHLMVTEALTVSAGVVNEALGDPTFDVNGGKSLTSQVAYSAEKFGASVGFNYGRDAGSPTAGVGSIAAPSERVALVDVVLAADPMENLSAWINYDYRYNNFTGGVAGHASTHGIAVAARLGVLEETGVALRFEYVTTDFSSSNTGTDTDNISLTGTIDQGLTDNLLVKAEVRWDNSDPASFRNKSGNTLSEDQVLGLLQMVYEF